MTAKNDDDALLVLFRNVALENPAKSAKAGRPIYDDVEMCEIRFPGRRDWQAHPVTEISHRVIDPYTGGDRRITYAERFERQYRQFKAHAAQTKSGTPLTLVSFLTEARRAELRALNIYTVEALAQLDGADLKNLGPGGREIKNAAEEFLENARRTAPDTQMRAELEALKMRNQLLEEDVKAMRDKARTEELTAFEKAMSEMASTHRTLAPGELSGPVDRFEGMSDDQLRAFVGAKTGQHLQGLIPRKTLVRMASETEAEAV